jgi:predicted nucleotide-binding protein
MIVCTTGAVMSRKAARPGDTPPSLTRSRDEAARLIQERIDRGVALRAREARTESDLGDLKRAESKWDAFNVELLRRLFDNASVSGEYDAGDPGASLVRSTLSQDIWFLRRDISRHIEVLESIIERLPLIPEQSPRPDAQSSELLDICDRKVLVAYGHNEKARVAMFSFLRALDLFPMEWAHMHGLAGKPGASNCEVVDAGLRAARAFVILLTPDEKVESAVPRGDGPSPSSRSQARPNVLAELGQTWGQDRTRTVIVSLGGVEPPSNFAGIQMAGIDNKPESRRRLASMLELAKCPVNDAGVDWLGPEAGGDFDGALATARDSARPSQPPGREEDKRREEIAREAVGKFETWCEEHFKNVRRDAGLLIRWIESGWTTGFHEFGYDILKLTVAELHRRGHEGVTCPMKLEYEGALQKWRSRPREFRQVDSSY